MNTSWFRRTGNKGWIKNVVQSKACLSALEMYVSLSYSNIWQTDFNHFHHYTFWIFLPLTLKFFDNLTYNSCNLIPFLLFCRMELASFSVTPLWATTKSSYFVITCEHSYCNNFLLKCNTNYLIDIYRLQKTVIEQYFFHTLYWNFLF